MASAQPRISEGGLNLILDLVLAESLPEPQPLPTRLRQGQGTRCHAFQCKIACNNDPLKGCFRVQ